MPERTISVGHNVEMAHRLFQTPGKCEAIHGHSWWIEITLGGEVHDTGMLNGLDFGLVKSAFRRELDTFYDHHVLLNKRDPWAQPIHLVSGQLVELPGLQTMNGDPTTENFADRIGRWVVETFINYQITSASVSVWETKVNRAGWSWSRNSASGVMPIATVKRADA